MEAFPDPLVINLAPTGMIPRKEDNEHTPISSDEIVEDVISCAEVGITMAHLHARATDGEPISTPEAFRPILEGIRACDAGRDLILCVTTSGRKVKDFEARAAVLDMDGMAKPDMASLTLGSLNFLRQESVNSPDMIRRLLQRMNDRGIKPELEVFDLGMVNFAKVLIKEGLLKPPYYFNLLVGNIASAQANLGHINMLIDDLPDGSYWSLAGLGRFQKIANGLAISIGGGVRVGLEDNIWLEEKPNRIPAKNIDLVKRVHAFAGAMGRPVASPAGFREKLGLGH
ncbi:MAG: 3-keto-5-aminohexanoate cleavage protein [Alphaproteobacteria bacterium]|nr:3-keto-5-aminohexanoate cleavage protein [Alphaproteobacteria bacterium]